MGRPSLPIEGKPCGALHFFYNTFVGRCLLKLAVRPWISKAAGVFLNSRLSACFIPRFIKKNGIAVEDYEQRHYRSFNDFFTRKAIPLRRPVDGSDFHLISPCDAKLAAYPVTDGGIFSIKDSFYTVEDLLQDKTLADEFSGGSCLIFRLSVNDYHRYCYIDSGTKVENIPIPGELHTVQPVALRRVNIFKRNSREYTIMDTAHFGRVVQVEVGALLVGRIRNHHAAYRFKRGEEKGYFEFGGSTVVLLFKKGVLSLDVDILDNTRCQRETIVKYGEKIGEGVRVHVGASVQGAQLYS